MDRDEILREKLEKIEELATFLYSHADHDERLNRERIKHDMLQIQTLVVNAEALVPPF